MAVDIPRETALKTLIDINEKGAYSNISLDRHLERSDLKGTDRAFITELVYGTMKWKLSIDFIIERFSSVKLSKISKPIMNILRLGVFQLMYTDRIPASAACNESVRLAKKYGHNASGGFVNAVLRNISRNSDKIDYPDKMKEPVKYLSVKYSHPEWMVRNWVKSYGEDFTEELLKSNNKTPDFIVRVNTLKTTRQDLIEALSKEGLEASEGKHAKEAVVIKNPSSVVRLSSFKDGLFQVQDESSMLVAAILDPKPDSLVIDSCSAPGGKATHIAQLMKNRGKIIARDVHEHKIGLIIESAKRLGITIIEPEVFDSEGPDTKYSEKADAVLVDAPCSGLGIIRRKPDIKWTRKPEDLKEITGLQKKILLSSSGSVKPGAILVYSTCTLGSMENEDIVKWFLDENREFYLEDITEFLPKGLQKATSSQGFIKLYPNTDGIDGFFIARMRRRG